MEIWSHYFTFCSAMVNIWITSRMSLSCPVQLWTGQLWSRLGVMVVFLVNIWMRTPRNYFHFVNVSLFSWFNVAWGSGVKACIQICVVSCCKLSRNYFCFKLCNPSLGGVATKSDIWEIDNFVENNDQYVEKRKANTVIGDNCL